MLKLKNVIYQLDEEVYNTLRENLKLNNADKFSTLLSLYRESVLSDEEIIDSLQVNINSFYTLKSRLFDKIQEHLTSQSTGSKFDLLKKATDIPELLFNTNKSIAIAILLKLEKDMLENDLPFELTNVYAALKKLYRDHPKYYEYSQLYNKHIAYMLATDKAEDQLSIFHKNVGEYLISNNKTQLEVLNLMKQEMTNISKLYQSHHLIVYRNIVNITFALFIPFPEAIRDDEPVEDYLKQCEKIFATYPKDTTYPYYKKVILFLAFEYYMQLNQYKKAQQYFEPLQEDLPSFLLCNHCTIPSKLLLSSIEFYHYNNELNKLFEDAQSLKDRFIPDTADHANFITFNLYLAASAFFDKNYQECTSLLNNLLNEIGFKNYPHAEIEVKLLLVLAYLKVKKYDQSESIMRSVTRKIKEMNEEGEYENAAAFVKILKSIGSGSNPKSVAEKLKKLIFNFNQFNKVPRPVLKFLKTDEDFVDILTKD